jgi:hypothetical protein
MSLNRGVQQRFRPGITVVFAAESPTEHFSTVFEDDGETGYFYAHDRRTEEGQILDAVHIYNVSAVLDRQIESVAEIVWSDDGLKSALLINDYPHAVFDFAAKRGYCRNDFPNFRPVVHGEWDTRTHQWDDAVMQFLQRPEQWGER